MMTTTKTIELGARIYNKGDMANLPKYGWVTALPGDGYVHVRYDDGSQSLYMPTTLFSAPHQRCFVVAQ